MRISDWSSDVCSSDLRAVCGQPTYSSAGIVAPQREVRNGVSIYRMRGTRFPKDRLFLRLLNVVTLSLATFWFLLFHVRVGDRSEEHTSELQSLMRISYAVFCLKKNTQKKKKHKHNIILTHR